MHQPRRQALTIRLTCRCLVWLFCSANLPADSSITCSKIPCNRASRSASAATFCTILAISTGSIASLGWPCRICVFISAKNVVARFALAIACSKSRRRISGMALPSLRRASELSRQPIMPVYGWGSSWAMNATASPRSYKVTVRS